MKMEIGRLQDLDVKAGDTLECVQSETGEFIKGGKYKVIADKGRLKIEGSTSFPFEMTTSKFRIATRADHPAIIGIDPAKPGSEFTIMPVEVAPGYDSLFIVLCRALDQAQAGKGKERHANDLPFDEQPIMQIGKMFGMGFQNGQAVKKMVEAQGMIRRGDFNAAEREILGAINYLAATVIEINQRATAQLKDQ